VKTKESHSLFDEVLTSAKHVFHRFTDAATTVTAHGAPIDQMPSPPTNIDILDAPAMQTQPLVRSSTIRTRSIVVQGPRLVRDSNEEFVESSAFDSGNHNFNQSGSQLADRESTPSAVSSEMPLKRISADVDDVPLPASIKLHDEPHVLPMVSTGPTPLSENPSQVEAMKSVSSSGGSEEETSASDDDDDVDESTLSSHMQSVPRNSVGRLLAVEKGNHMRSSSSSAEGSGTSRMDSSSGVSDSDSNSDSADEDSFLRTAGLGSRKDSSSSKLLDSSNEVDDDDDDDDDESDEDDDDDDDDDDDSVDDNDNKIGYGGKVLHSAAVSNVHLVGDVPVHSHILATASKHQSPNQAKPGPMVSSLPPITKK
jgi:hypothetical protein